MGILEFYVPSNSILQALKVHFNDESLKATDANFGTYLKTPQLDYDNVSSVLNTLISIEDVSTMHIYAQLMETDLIVQEHDPDHNIYKIMLTKTKVNAADVLTADMDELVLVPKASLINSPLPKHIILAQLPHMHENLPSGNPMRRHACTIKEVNRTSIKFIYKRNTKDKKKFDVIFRSARVPFRLMYRALNLLKMTPMMRRYLFPVPNTIESKLKKLVLSESEDLSLLNPTIATNAEQLQAVQQIVAGPSNQAPYIVFGPPGTGKTTTIVEAILQLYLRNGRIIVTAGSNSACDTIALRICESIQNDERFMDSDGVLKKVLIRLYSYTRYLKGLKSVHPLVLKNSNCNKIAEDLKKKESKKNSKGIIGIDFGIIVATLCTVGILFIEADKRPKTTHVFIDEAAASTEAESLLGIMGIKDSDCHVILSGDHKQLGAVIKSKRASSLGLGQSLMERLLLCKLYEVDASGNYDCTLQTRLRRNYRSHPEIVGLYNKLYYNNELIPLAPLQHVNLAANWNILPNAKFPILFQATFGETARESNSTSSYNEMEVQVLCWYVQTLLRKGLGNNVKVQQEDIGVVTPYLAQCKLLKMKLRGRGQSKVEVGSVESYQGREKPIIIASLVSSFKSTGFVSDPRRLNVLLSRAKSLMIIIGNPISLSQKNDLKFIIDQCKLHGNFLSKRDDKKKKLRSKSNKDITV